MNRILSQIQSLFPNREVYSIYDVGSSKSDILVVEDWTFFQLSTKFTCNSIVLVTSIEDYIHWRRMLQNSVRLYKEIFIQFTYIIEQNNNFLKKLIDQDRLLGIKFLKY